MSRLPILDTRFPIFRIADRRLQIKNSLLIMSCVLYLAFCSLLASAETVKVVVKEARVAGDGASSVSAQVIDGDVVILEEGEAIGTPGANVEIIEIDDPNAEDRSVDVEMQDGNARGERFRRFRQDGRPGQRPGERVSPEARRRDPEFGRELREESGRRFRERERDLQPGGGPAEGAPREREGRRGEPGDEGLNRYMDAVVKNNLFLPLGSGGEERGPSFALTAVISNTSDGADSKAIIAEKGGEKSYYLSRGDSFADEVKVVNIDEQTVKLDRSGEEMTLRLGEGTEGGRRGGMRGRGNPGEGGERRPGGEGGESRGGSRRGGENFDPGEIPPFVMRVLEERGISIDELRSNPDLQEELRREFEQRRGGGGGPQRMMRIERGRSQGGDRRRRR